MAEFAYCLAWEWINIAMEYTAGSWARLPRFFWVAVALNLATHPLFIWFVDRYDRASWAMFAGEAVVWTVEWALLCIWYRKVSRLKLLAVSVSMNAASWLTGVLLNVV